MRRLKTYGIHLLVISGVLFFLSYQVGGFKGRLPDTSRAATSLSIAVSTLQSQLDGRFSDSAWSKIVRERSYWYHLPELILLPYEVLLYRDDSLVFWNQNIVIPSPPASSFSEGLSFQKFRNGYYLLYSKKLPSANLIASYNLLILLPVKYEYMIANSYLKPHFSDLFKIDNYFIVSSTGDVGFLPVTDAAGKILFYVGTDPSEFAQRASVPAVLLFFSALLLLVLFIDSILSLLPADKFVWVRPLILFGMFFGLSLLLTHKSILPDGVANWKIFDPGLFASSGVASSLGSLLILLLFLFWVCIHITNRVQIRFRVRQTAFLNYLIHVVGYSIIFFLTIYTVDVIRALVRDSKIQFSFLNPLEPDYYSLIGVWCIALLFICLFLLSLKIISILSRSPLKPLDNGIILLICTMLAIMYYLAFDTGISGLYVMVWSNILILILPYFNLRSREGLNFGRIIMLLVFVSASGAALLQVYSEEKEQDRRINLAKKLISTGDAVTEYLLSDLQPKISSDEFIISFYKSPQISGKILIDRLQQLYFQEGFSRYAIRYFPVDLKGYLLPVEGEDFGFVTEIGMKAGKEELIPGELYHSSSPSGVFTYLAEFPILERDTLLGRLFVELNANAYQSTGVYPELLLEEKDKLPFNIQEYSFAIYQQNHLIEQRGNSFYNYHLKWLPDDRREEKYVSDGGSNHLIYNAGNNLVIVVSKKNNWFSYFISYFSFLFLVFFTITLLVLGFNMLSIYPTVRTMRQFLRAASLRTLIHGFFMIFILAVLLIVGYVAGSFFLKQFNDLSQHNVIEKINRVTESVQFLFNQNEVSATPIDNPSTLLKKNLGALANVQDIDINFYDLHGNLVASSQPSFFEKGLISRKMNPVAYSELIKEGMTVLVREEEVGTLKFYSGYQAIRSSGAPLLFIHLPYFNSRSYLNEQVGFFFVALVNILVFATILAGLLAPLISRQITRKLSLIGDKFKKVKVGSGNELIEWQANDEIGSLVNEYNKMIAELEESANRLAKSERELAWREMAQQVAHEIKNPLTPMKLSMQHLQRAYERNDPNLKEMVAKVSGTLVEQIDNLSEIATEFSNFAKMPRPEVEPVNVNDVLRSAFNLHRETNEVHLQLHHHAEKSTVLADRNQLLSVFNNLILNAIQAIPENREGSVNVITENMDSQLVVSVSDNGIGISDEEGKKVFRPNFTTKSSGTGLGLAISKSIIESFGGTISFTSDKNVGTTFFVKIPVVEM